MSTGTAEQTDLVERLRAGRPEPMVGCDLCAANSATWVRCNRGDCANDARLIAEAADEIERLRQLIADHNAGCQSRCGIGEQEAAECPQCRSGGATSCGNYLCETLAYTQDLRILGSWSIPTDTTAGE